MKSLDDLFFDTLADIYDAEHRIAEALPKMSAATDPGELRDAFEDHLIETRGHIEKVERVFEAFERKPRRKTCEATRGLIREGDEISAEFVGSPALDAALISAAQKVEHYEIATYGCLATWAGLLENDEAQALLHEILNDEENADERLSEIAREESNPEAMDENPSA